MDLLFWYLKFCFYSERDRLGGNSILFSSIKVMKTGPGGMLIQPGTEHQVVPRTETVKRVQNAPEVVGRV